MGKKIVTSFSGGIICGNKGILNITGALLLLRGTGARIACLSVEISGWKGGSCTATGSGKPGIEVMGTFELSGGTISTKSNSGGNRIFAGAVDL